MSTYVLLGSLCTCLPQTVKMFLAPFSVRWPQATVTRDYGEFAFHRFVCPFVRWQHWRRSHLHLFYKHQYFGYVLYCFFVCCFLTWRLSLPPSPFRRVFFAADIEPSAMSVCCVGVLFLHHTLRLLPSPFRCIAVTIVCFRHSAVRHEIVLLIST